MSTSVNRVILIGNLGRDAETKFTSSGKAMTSFSLALTERWKDQSGEAKEKTTWVNVLAWGKERLAEYLKKGKQVYVEGKLSTRNYEKDGHTVYVTEVVADDIRLLGGRESQEERPARQQSQPARQAAKPQAKQEEKYEAGFEDIPF